MKKTYIIILVSTLAILGLGVGAYFFVFHHQSPTWDIATTTTPIVATPTYEEQRANIEKQNEQNSELYNTAMRDQDKTLCNAISDTSQKSECSDMIAANIARKSGTIEACDTLSSTGVTLICRDVILGDRAIAQVDRTLCETISDTDRR